MHQAESQCEPQCRASFLLLAASKEQLWPAIPRDHVDGLGGRDTAIVDEIPEIPEIPGTPYLIIDAIPGVRGLQRSCASLFVGNGFLLLGVLLQQGVFIGVGLAVQRGGHHDRRLDPINFWLVRPVGAKFHGPVPVTNRHCRRRFANDL